MAVFKNENVKTYVQSGTGTPSEVDGVGGDLYVTGDLEADGIVYVNPATLTSGGTDDFAVEIVQTLNDPGAAGGSDLYTGLKINLTTTDTTGWDNVYFATLGSGGSAVFTFADDGVFGVTSGAGSLALSHSTDGIIDVLTSGSLALKLAGTSKAVVDAGGLTTDNVSALTASTTLTIQDQSFSAADSAVTMATGTATQSSGTYIAAEVTPTINQSGTAGYTAFKINVTESATGSGDNILMSVGTGGSEQFQVDTNAGISQFSASGESQYSKASVSTTDATVTTIDTTITDSDSCTHITATVAGIETVDGDEAASYVIHGTFKNDGGVLSQIGTTTTSHSAEDTAGWNATLAISGVNVLVQVTGAASTNIDWHATISKTLVGGA